MKKRYTNIMVGMFIGYLLGAIASHFIWGFIEVPYWLALSGGSAAFYLVIIMTHEDIRRPEQKGIKRNKS